MTGLSVEVPSSLGLTGSGALNPFADGDRALPRGRLEQVGESLPGDAHHGERKGGRMAI